VDVQDLFFNTPVRAKFMKKDSTERAQHPANGPRAGAGASPGQLRDLGRRKSGDAPGAREDVRSRISDLWDASINDTLVPLEFSQGPVSVHGFINKVPAHHRQSPISIYFVNHRPSTSGC